MIATLTIVRYPRWMGWAGFISMALFRLPLWLNKKSSFWKLLGCGKNGTFDLMPDWCQWGLLEIWGSVPDENNTPNSKHQTPNFILSWWKFFHCETGRFVLQPIEGHGTWDGKPCFGDLAKQTDYEGQIAVLTRATIRINKLIRFWKNVDSVAERMHSADGFITSIGIGEMPFIKQATFSIWESKMAMKQFAYQAQQHAEVIRKTRKENWYSEDMFVRFIVLEFSGTLSGKNPFKRKS